MNSGFKVLFCAVLAIASIQFSCGHYNFDSSYLVSSSERGPDDSWSVEDNNAIYHRVTSSEESSDDDPLLLSSLIESGQIEEARTRSKVNLGGITSYTGYITVNKTCNANLFFWFVPSKTNTQTAPLLVWLQGGPGASSLFGLFEEHGPFYVSKEHPTTLLPRKIAWTASHSVIYIDSPVGTGYSFTDQDECYATNQVDVGRDLYSFVIQFLTLFPELQNNDFFVTGESYGGKYVPALSYTIHQQNSLEETALKINFKGMAIGNGLCDPYNMLEYGDYLYQLGMIDDNQRDHFHQMEEQGRTYIKNGQWLEAFEQFDDMINGDLISYPSYFKNVTGSSYYFNYLHTTEPNSTHGDFEKYIQLDEIRKVIHVGNRTRHNGTEVEKHLVLDVAKSVKPWIEELLDSGYRVLFYNGQLDIIVAYPLTVSFLRTVDWSGAEEYKTADRKIWRVGPDVAGYAKTVGNMTEVLVRKAGHMVPADQPYWAFDLISRFTAGKPF